MRERAAVHEEQSAGAGLALVNDALLIKPEGGRDQGRESMSTPCGAVACAAHGRWASMHDKKAM